MLEEKAKIAEEKHPDTSAIIDDKHMLELKTQDLKKRLMATEEKLEAAERTAEAKLAGGE